MLLQRQNLSKYSKLLQKGYPVKSIIATELVSVACHLFANQKFSKTSCFDLVKLKDFKKHQEECSRNQEDYLREAVSTG
jgi:hypothetical protein